MSKKIILVPDIHGRAFWKNCVPFVDECDKIVFLGDYHDPYDYEGISVSQSMSNFNEIISFAKQYPDKVTLLLGNHDLTYYNTDNTPNWNVFSNRVDWKNRPEISSLFRTNSKLFNIVSMASVDDNRRKFLFSHAGIHPLWVKDHKLVYGFNDDTTAETICNNISNKFLTEDIKLLEALRCIGAYRGGYEPVGSIVWADCHEFMNVKQTPYTQVFGHTQQLIYNEKEIKWEVGKPFVTGTNVCIDCHQCFYIDDEGTIKNLKTEETIY